MNLHLMKFLATIIFVMTCISVHAQTVWYDPMDAETPYISGRGWNEEIGKSFARIPDRLRGGMTKAVSGLAQNSAGLSVKFLSNSENVTVKYTLNRIGGFVNMPKLDFAGIDMYARDANGRQHWIGNHMKWNFSDTITYTYNNLKAPEFASRGLEFEVFLPPYSTVTSLQIGVDEGSKFKFLHESAERPIVIYGSSIVQGASPSRPGLMWTTQIKRSMDYPVINLGFSGSAYMEPEVFEAMGEIQARAYVLDPMPNSYKLGEEIQKRMENGVKNLRSKNNAPILLVECAGSVDSVFRKDINGSYREGDQWLLKAYNSLVSQGVENLFYLTKDEIGMDEDSYIEGTHPNDIGNRLYAQAVEKKLREMMPEDAPNNRFPPIQQFRDGLYTWQERHNEVINLNHTTDPEVLCIGNSITHFWGGEPISRNNGGNTWEKLWGKRRVVNMGFGWDKIENVFWRINHGELEGCAPDEIFLLIGINNINMGDKEEDVARGIIDLAAAIQARQPQAMLYVLEIYPAKGKEENVAYTNKLLREWLIPNEHLKLISLNNALLLNDGSGKINPEMFIEGLHPNEKGYAALAKELKKQVGIK